MTADSTTSKVADVVSHAVLRSWRFTSTKSRNSKIKNQDTSAFLNSQDKSVAESTGTTSTHSSKSSNRRGIGLFGGPVVHSKQGSPKKSLLSYEDKTRIRAMNFIYLENIAAAEEEKAHLRLMNRWNNGSRCNNSIQIVEPSDESEIMDWLNSESHVQNYFTYNQMNPLCFSFASKQSACKSYQNIQHSEPEAQNHNTEHPLPNRFAPVFPIIVEEEDFE